MNEKPIIFSGQMVRAILEGRKVQTRRVVKPQPPVDELGRPEHGKILGPKMFEPVAYDRHGEMIPGPEVFGAYDENGEWGAKCPFGSAGTKLWVRENFQPLYAKGFLMEDVDYETGHGYAPKYMATDPVHEYLDHNTDQVTDKITPSIFMPRWACRLLLDVRSVRVERLQEISGKDARAEGMPHPIEPIGIADWKPAGWFRTTWDLLNKKRGFGWDSNPYVWVIDFSIAD